MTRPQRPVLVDTNAIIEAHRVKGWLALVRSYHVETVEDCVTETQTGFQNRPPEQRIDAQALRAALTAVHSVGDNERATLALKTQGIYLDLGEKSLWAHALGRDEPWVLCGPDTASIRAGVRLRLHDRLIALESLFGGIGHKPKVPLRELTPENGCKKHSAN